MFEDFQQVIVLKLAKFSVFLAFCPSFIYILSPMVKTYKNVINVMNQVVARLESLVKHVF